MSSWGLHNVFWSIVKECWKARPCFFFLTRILKKSLMKLFFLHSFQQLWFANILYVFRSHLIFCKLNEWWQWVKGKLQKKIWIPNSARFYLVCWIFLVNNYLISYQCLSSFQYFHWKTLTWRRDSHRTVRFLHWVFCSHGKRNWTYIRVAVIFSSYLVRLFSYSDP